MPKYKFSDIAINSTEKKKPVEEDKYTYIGLEHLDPGTLTVSRWGAEVAPIGEKLIMKKGDVLFGKRRAYQKKVGIAPFDGIFSAHGMVLRPKEEVITKEYFPLFISSDYFLDEAIRISVGSLSPTINWKNLKELEFTIPSIEEQKRVAPVIWAAIDTKNAYQKLLQETVELIKAQFIEMFRDPIQNEKKWLTQPLSKVAPQKKADIEIGENVWILNLDMIESGSGNIIEKVYVSPNKIGASTGTFDSRMVLYSKLRPYLNKVVLPDEDGVATNELVAMLPRRNLLRREFLAALLRGDQFLSYAIHISEGAQMPRMPVKELKEFKCILPPVELQDEFICLMKQSDKSKHELRQAIDDVDYLIKSLVQQELK